MKFFSERSKSNLATCDERLVRVCTRALDFNVADFTVIEGHRTLAKQRDHFAAGRSKADGVRKISKHQHLPSLAVDLMPWPAEVNGINVWHDVKRFSVLAGLIYAAAAIEGVQIVWGGDWDGDGNNADSSLDDLPHFELR